MSTRFTSGSAGPVHTLWDMTSNLWDTFGKTDAKEVSGAVALSAIESGVKGINKYFPKNTIDDLAYNIMTQDFDWARNFDDIALATKDWLDGKTTDWDAIQGGGLYTGFVPNFSNLTGTSKLKPGEEINEEENRLYQYLAPLNSDGEPVDITSIYLQREDNNLDESEYSLYDEVNQKNGHFLFNNVLKHYDNHPAMDDESRNKAYSIKEFSRFIIPKVGFESTIYNNIVKGSGNIIGTGQDLTYEAFHDYYTNLMEDNIAQYGDMIDIEKIKLARSGNYPGMDEYLKKKNAIENALNDFHLEYLPVRDIYEDPYFQDAPFTTNIWEEQKKEGGYIETTDALRQLLKNKEPIIWRAQQHEGVDGRYDVTVRGRENRSIHPIFHFNTIVDLDHHSRVLNYDPDKKQYYYAVVDSWDFFDNDENYEEPSRSFDDILEGKWNVRDQLKEIVNAAGKPIPMYDRYYISNDEMQGVLNFYQLDLEGNQTTVIDDLVNQQVEEYEEIE